MKLFICEKPSQAKDIAKVLGVTKRTDACFEGNALAVTWCVGHLLELAPPDYYCDSIKPWRMEILPIVPKNWVLMPQEKTKKQLNAIGKLLKKACSVVIATDADREGDVIGREVLDFFNYQGPVERLWLSALDDVSIKKALQTIKPGSATECLYQAGLGRQRADWLMGMNLTMAVSSLYAVPGQGVLSVGRVQTPTLKLVVDRDLSIEHFKAQDYYVLKAQCQSANQELFWVTWEIPEEYSEDDGKCTNKTTIDEVARRINGKEGRVILFQELDKREAPPLCLSLSSLQQIASSQLGLSAKHTLDIAQALYEQHKATSYPRTDCGYLPESQFSEAGAVFEALKQVDPEVLPLINRCSLQVKSKVWNSDKITAHHGIIPTLNSKVNLKAMTEFERKVYQLIRSYYLAQFLGEYEFVQRQVALDVEGHRFKASAHLPRVLGWKTAITPVGEREDDESDSDASENIPKLMEHERVSIHKSQTDSRKTKPKPRFTEGSLIAAMKSIAKNVENPQLKKILKETSGIGTEATRANILETLLSREYLKRQGKQLISTPKGRELIQQLPQSITNPATTALWEQILEEIAQGKHALGDFLEEQSDTLSGMLEQLKKQRPVSAVNSIYSCPDCQKALIKRQGQKGGWWGCSGYPQCKTHFKDQQGRPLMSSTLNVQ
jgi:DNA topoisomerase-3